MNTAEQIARILLDIGAVALNATEPFRYTSGILSPIYCDNRLIISYPEKRKQVIDAFIQMIDDQHIDYDVIGGVATGAIAHAAWVADRLTAPMVYIRAEAKKHGKKNQVEGHLEEGARVLIIEDLISTGGSSVASVDAVRQAGGVVLDCIAIMTYEMPSSRQKFSESKTTLHTLTTFSALISVAVETGYLQKDEQEKVLAWNQDPAGWGKAMGYEQ